MHSVWMSVEDRVADRVGLSERAEQLFETTSNAFVLLLACAWIFSVASERRAGHKVNIVRPGASAAMDGFNSAAAANEAYIRDVANKSVVAPVEGGATGESGKLLAQIKGASDQPEILKAAVAVSGTLRRIADFSFITLRQAGDVRGGRLDNYYIGSWPRRTTTKGGRVAYNPPNGFVEVTPENENTRLSEHFRIRDFLTHDQPNVWPKYVVVNMKLVDKLELVLSDLEAHGVNTSGVHVMSGFRTPQYNHSGGDPRGRASLSRHMYGDAADIYIDNTGSGAMSDLNHDGRVDIGDARVILASVNRVEQKHPSLVGGCGIYVGNAAHGPFVHIDTRGYPARWTGTGD